MNVVVVVVSTEVLEDLRVTFVLSPGFVVSLYISPKDDSAYLLSIMGVGVVLEEATFLKKVFRLCLGATVVVVLSTVAVVFVPSDDEEEEEEEETESAATGRLEEADC